MAPLLTLLLACGPSEPEVVVPPPEPLPVVVPPWVVGTWARTTMVDSREVVALPCQGEPAGLVIEPTRTMTSRDGSGQQVHLLTMAELQADGSARLTTASGSLVLHDREQGFVLARGDLPGFEAGIRLASLGSDEVERHPPTAASCARPLDLQPLRTLGASRFNNAGDACAVAGLTLPAEGGRPRLHRAGLDLRIEGIAQHQDEVWLTVATASGALSGMRLVPEASGLRVWQRTADEMRSELLRPAEGGCRR